MTDIVHSLEPITLVGAGISTIQDLERCRVLAPRVIAADGGALACLKYGVTPEVVLGDMDSVQGALDLGLPTDRLHHVAEQENTDFDKALSHIRAPVVLGVGFSGARLDHQLACYNTLVRHPDRRCVILGDTDIAFLAPPSLDLPLEAGTRVSLFPMALVEGVSDGLEWPIQGLVFTPDGRVGTSNAAQGPVSLVFTAPKMLIILPRACLELAVAALARQPGSWTAL
nr:thiamine diphosphokinase [uncultured Shimia sp.]